MHGGGGPACRARSARARARGTRVLALASVLALLAPLFSGCLTLTPAHVPDRVLAQHPGWRKDPAHSEEEPGGSAITKQQTLAYKDEAKDDRGYPASITVITLRSLVTPDEGALVEQVRELVRSAAENRGIRVDAETTGGERAIGNGATTRFFVYNGTVTQESGFFARNAKTKILGEVFRCQEERTSVVVVGLAQVTDTRSIGGVSFPSNSDATTWKEIAADPSGTVEGYRGNGLAYGVACG